MEARRRSEFSSLENRDCDGEAKPRRIDCAIGLYLLRAAKEFYVWPGGA
jgi:hypothetical protein